jgi:hypothetical protein
MGNFYVYLYYLYNVYKITTRIIPVSILETKSLAGLQNAQMGLQLTKYQLQPSIVHINCFELFN